MAKTRTTPRVSLRFVEDLIARHLELERQLEALQAEKARVDAAVSLGLLAPEAADAARRQIKRKPQLRVSPP